LERSGAKVVSARSSKVLLGLLDVSRRCEVVQGKDYTLDLRKILGTKLLG
jgi:hypothetical protein